MSGQPPSGGANPPVRSASMGGMNGIMSMPSVSRPVDTGLGGNSSAGQPQSTMSTQALNQIVIEYLNKKGYVRTEAMLRTEGANQDADGNIVHARVEDKGAQMYQIALELFARWIEGGLDIYKAELRRLRWPIFVHSILALVKGNHAAEKAAFHAAFEGDFQSEHADELRDLKAMSMPSHLELSRIAKLYYANQYRLTLCSMAFNLATSFLESRERDGGSVILGIITERLRIVVQERPARDQNSINTLLARAAIVEDFPAEDEGIPGHHPGSANLDNTARSTVLTKLKLGPLPMETELLMDVRGDLADEDEREPAPPGKSTYLQHFETMIKREEGEDYPTTADIPYPPSEARDVALEVQKVKENRDRFKIDGRTGGAGAGVSICAFTVHNANESITCMDFSGDNKLFACGTDQSYIIVFDMVGDGLKSAFEFDTEEPNARKLIGHSEPVYGVSFSPSIDCHRDEKGDPLYPETHPMWLLSCSQDKTIRLWNLEIWQCLVVYKGHDRAIHDIKWGPFGHYFLTGGSDRTARLWVTHNATYQRLFIGHDDDVDIVAWHPNSAYVFSASCDKTVRMWAVNNGFPVRLFTGHTSPITSMACSPNGNILASADMIGTIILWDLAAGRLIKRMRGHAYGGVWSLDWCAESTVLISGGADCTVRLWDVNEKPAVPGLGRVVGDGGAARAAEGPAAAGPAGSRKKKARENIVTSDQIAAYPTKKTPIFNAHFTRMNLAVVGGCFNPDLRD